MLNMTKVERMITVVEIRVKKALDESRLEDAREGLLELEEIAKEVGFVTEFTLNLINKWEELNMKQERIIASLEIRAKKELKKANLKDARQTLLELFDCQKDSGEINLYTLELLDVYKTWFKVFAQFEDELGFTPTQTVQELKRVGIDIFDLHDCLDEIDLKYDYVSETNVYDGFEDKYDFARHVDIKLTR